MKKTIKNVLKLLGILLLVLMFVFCSQGGSSSGSGGDDDDDEVPSLNRTVNVTINYGGVIDATHPVRIGIWNNANTATWTSANKTNGAGTQTNGSTIQIATITYSPFYVGVFSDTDNDGDYDVGVEDSEAYNNIAFGGMATAINVAAGGSTSITIDF